LLICCIAWGKVFVELWSGGVVYAWSGGVTLICDVDYSYIGDNLLIR